TEDHPSPPSLHLTAPSSSSSSFILILLQPHAPLKTCYPPLWTRCTVTVVLSLYVIRKSLIVSLQVWFQNRRAKWRKTERGSTDSEGGKEQLSEAATPARGINSQSPVEPSRKHKEPLDMQQSTELNWINTKFIIVSTPPPTHTTSLPSPPLQPSH
uniref:Homeobox domain-containing protein n=1 Tax=Hippocampus comes TaxID=109280 RepID=A0A3Q2XZR6_HIPCM